jgi:hypothetical protein
VVLVDAQGHEVVLGTRSTLRGTRWYWSTLWGIPPTGMPHQAPRSRGLGHDKERGAW